MSRPTFRLTGRVSLTVLRRGKGYLNYYGEWVEGDIEEVVIDPVNVQPLDYKELIQIPEPHRTRDMIKIYSPEPLLEPLEGDDGRDGDVVVWEGKEYAIESVKVYRMGVLDHWKAIGVRKKLSGKSK